MGVILSVAPSHAKNGYYVGFKGVLYIQICEICPFLLGGMSARTLGRGQGFLSGNIYLCVCSFAGLDSGLSNSTMFCVLVS